MKDKLSEQFFDFEVFPNWWCCVIGRYPQDDNIPEDIKKDFFVISSDNPNAANILLEQMRDRNYVNFGYNIKRYDNIILNAVACGFTPHQISIVSEMVIDPETEYKDTEHMRLSSFAHKRYTDFIYQDMLDDNTGSLKEKEACMQLDIRESTVPFSKEDLTDEDKADIISYCKHDVWSSMMFYKIVLKPFIKTKLLVGKTFNIPMDVCYKSTNAQLSGMAINAVKTKFTDADRTDIVIPEGLREYIRYSLPKEVVDKLCVSGDKYVVKLFGSEVVYANGGIHSVPITPSDVKRGRNWALIAESNDEWALINVDAASFYPATMINWHTLSRAVKNPDKFAEMYHARLEYKKVIEPFEEKYGKHPEYAPEEERNYYQQCKDTSQAYKLILNTTYGASGNKYLALYDPYMTTVTCRLGQLLLTSLANNIYNQIGKNNVMIVQTNTDGILCYIRRSTIDLLHKIGDEFTRITHIMLEYEEESKIWQRDVNNYVMRKRNGRTKTKGGYFVTDMIQPGYNRVRPLDGYVCREALIAYLTEGKDIMQSVLQERDLSKFVVTCHKGSFSGIVRQFNDGRPNEELHRCNRVYASLNEDLGIIAKKKKIKGEWKYYKAPGCPPHCELINKDLSSYDFDEIAKDIDYLWYINETIEMLNDAEWYVVDGAKMRKIKIFDEQEYLK